MLMLCGIWIFTTVRSAFYSIKAGGFTHCCWGSLMIIPACAATLSGIRQKDPIALDHLTGNEFTTLAYWTETSVKVSWLRSQAPPQFPKTHRTGNFEFP